MTKLWGGRFSGATDALMKQFNDSISFDIRLWDADIRGSIAYASALAKAGVITKKEAAALHKGLRAVHVEFATGAFEVKGDEDIHSAVERRLKEIVGDVAGKLHTGRSRNDQVATDMRLFCRSAISDLQSAMCDLQSALLVQTEANISTLMPGYTHMQRAQPITFAHWCLSYFWQFARDVDRLNDCAKRTAVSPLGSGALAGNPFGVDRAALAAELFSSPRRGGETEKGDKDSASPRLRGEISCNSLDGVSDRDFVAELLFCCAIIGVHLSRLAEDLILYSTAEFGFVAFDDAYSTGSSLMPQKKNPDAMELARGKSGRLIGNLVSLLTVLKGLPMTYNKDLQEDKEGLFDSLDTLSLTLPVVAGAIGTLRVNADKMRAALDPAMLATDVAEYLVRKGVPFREAHHLSGRAVALAEQRGVGIDALDLSDWRGISPKFDVDIARVFGYEQATVSYEQSAASRDVVGGTSPRAVKEQMRAASAWLKRNDHGKNGARRTRS